MFPMKKPPCQIKRLVKPLRSMRLRALLHPPCLSATACSDPNLGPLVTSRNNFII